MFWPVSRQLHPAVGLHQVAVQLLRLHRTHPRLHRCRSRSVIKKFSSQFKKYLCNMQHGIWIPQTISSCCYVSIICEAESCPGSGIGYWTMIMMPSRAVNKPSRRFKMHNCHPLDFRYFWSRWQNGQIPMTWKRPTNTINGQRKILNPFHPCGS